MMEGFIILNQENGKLVSPLIERVGKAGMKALLFLYRYGETNAYSMTKKADMGSNVTTVLLKLGALNLVTQEKGDGNENIYKLTEKGQKVTEYLDLADQILTKST
jgi:hypothetical protein